MQSFPAQCAQNDQEIQADFLSLSRSDEAGFALCVVWTRINLASWLQRRRRIDNQLVAQGARVSANLERSASDQVADGLQGR